MEATVTIVIIVTTVISVVVADVVSATKIVDHEVDVSVEEVIVILGIVDMIEVIQEISVDLVHENMIMTL